jgi:hypothetical protein
MDIAMRAAISSFEMWSGMLLLRLGVAQLLSVGEKLGSFRAAISKNTSIINFTATCHFRLKYIIDYLFGAIPRSMQTQI